MGWIASRLRRRGSPAPAEPPTGEHEPQPAPEPEIMHPQRAEPEPSSPPRPQDVAPREWNLWDLERIARERGADDVARTEERGYLLMYLREFASADGMLPADFDALVRESFADVLDPVYS